MTGGTRLWPWPGHVSSKRFMPRVLHIAEYRWVGQGRNQRTKGTIYRDGMGSSRRLRAVMSWGGRV